MRVARIARAALLTGLTAFVVLFVVAALGFVGPWTGLALCMYSLLLVLASSVTIAVARLLSRREQRR
jgi:cation transport ATPase